MAAVQLLSEIEYRNILSSEVQARTTLQRYIQNEQRVSKGLGPMRRFLVRCIHIQRATKLRYSLAANRLNSRELISRRDTKLAELQIALGLEDIALQLGQQSGRLVLERRWIYDSMMLWRGWVRLLHSSSLHRAFYGIWKLELDLTRYRYIVPIPTPPPHPRMIETQTPDSEVTRVSAPARPKYDTYVYTDATKPRHSGVVEALLFDRLELVEAEEREEHFVKARLLFVAALRSKATMLHLPDQEQTKRWQLESLEASKTATILRQSIFTLAYHARRDVEEQEFETRKMDLEREAFFGLSKILKLALAERRELEGKEHSVQTIQDATRSSSAKREVEERRQSRSRSREGSQSPLSVRRSGGAEGEDNEDHEETNPRIESASAQHEVAEKLRSPSSREDEGEQPPKFGSLEDQITAIQSVFRSNSAKRAVEEKRRNRSRSPPKRESNVPR